MLNSFRPGPLFCRQVRRRRSYNVTQAVLRSDDFSRSNLGYRRPFSSSHSEQDSPQRPPKSVIPLLGVALASAFLGYGLAKSSALAFNAGGTNTNHKFGSPEDIKTAINALRGVWMRRRCLLILETSKSMDSRRTTTIKVRSYLLQHIVLIRNI